MIGMILAVIAMMQVQQDMCKFLFVGVESAEVLKLAETSGCTEFLTPEQKEIIRLDQLERELTPRFPGVVWGVVKVVSEKELVPGRWVYRLEFKGDKKTYLYDVTAI